MANEVQIVLTAVDKASAVLKNTGTETTGLADKLVGLAKSAGAVALAYKGFEYLKTATTDTVLYAEEVRDLSRALGINAKESSYLIQMADDLKIELPKLQMAFRYALSKGVDPSIAGIKKLAAEYKKLPDPISKAQFAMENFGERGGLEMQKVLALTAEQIDEMAQSAEDAGLVLTDEAVVAAREYEIAMDDLGDAAEGLKVKIGRELIPVVTDFAVLISDMMSLEPENWFEDGADAAAKFINKMIYGKTTVENFNTAAQRFSADDFIGNLGGMAGAAEDTAGKIDLVTASIKKVDKAQLLSTAVEAIQKAYKEGAIPTFDEYIGLLRDTYDTYSDLSDEEIDQAINVEYLRKAYEDGNSTLNDYLATLKYLGQAWGDIPRDVTTTYTIHYKKVGGPSTEPGPDVPVVVPEEPYVPGPGQQSVTPGSGTSSQSVNIVQNFYDSGAAALGMAYVETLRGQRLDASMGR